MVHPRVIEVAGEAVAIVVPDEGQFRFVAVKYDVWSLEAHLFDSAEAARIAAHRLMKPAARQPLEAGF